MKWLEAGTESQAWRYATRKIGVYVVLTAWVEHWQIYRLAVTRSTVTPVKDALNNYCLQRRIRRLI